MALKALKALNRMETLQNFLGLLQEKHSRNI
jgi:hypothetical protein